MINHIFDYINLFLPLFWICMVGLIVWAALDIKDDLAAFLKRFWSDLWVCEECDSPVNVHWVRYGFYVEPCTKCIEKHTQEGFDNGYSAGWDRESRHEE